MRMSTSVPQPAPQPRGGGAGGRVLWRTVSLMGLLDGKKIVITGVLTDASLAFGVARLALDEGAEIVLTGAGRGLRLTQRTARKLPGGSEIPVLEFDVTNEAHVAEVRDDLAARWGRVDGVLHAIGFAPEACLGDDFMAATWDDVAVAMHISAYSHTTLAEAFVPLMSDGGSLVGLDFSTQASTVNLGPLQIQLQNAIDIMIGTF